MDDGAVSVGHRGADLAQTLTLPRCGGPFAVDRLTSSGRWQAHCPQGHLFWLTPRELAAWQHCPSCLGWIRAPDPSRTRSIAMATAQYNLEITGLEPPYKWRLLRSINRGSPVNLGDGQADTREEAQIAAQQLARDKERQRQLENSVIRIHLFTVDDAQRERELRELEQALQSDA